MSDYGCKVLGSSDITLYFKTIQTLGSGGYGEVYLAETTDLARSEIDAALPAQVAVKKLILSKIEKADKSGQKGSTKDSIINEITVLKTLKLKHSPKYYGCFENDTHLYIVMEYINGNDLFDIVEKDIQSGARKEGNYIKKLVTLARDIALAIMELHNAGYVHRDIKPENIMIVTDPEIKVILVDYAFTCDVNKPWDGCKQKMGTATYYDFKSKPGDFESMKMADWWAFGQSLVVMFLVKQLCIIKGEEIICTSLKGYDIHRLRTIGMPESFIGLIVDLTNKTLDQTQRPSADTIIAILTDMASSM